MVQRIISGLRLLAKSRLLANTKQSTSTILFLLSLGVKTGCSEYSFELVVALGEMDSSSSKLMYIINTNLLFSRPRNVKRV